ncbi:MAG: heme-binding protein, partial [Opitutaceae bacterium]|nr:heme-binding protein [Opitutaceae bacterium]
MINLRRSIRLLLPFLTAVVLGAADNTRLELEPARSSPAKGKHVVLLSGDEEYRSEEALPMLAKILSQSHGFKTTVLFALDADGTINPNNPHSLPGAEALDSADVIIMSLRFRAWSDEAMKHFVAAHQRGVPIIALRTSTHAFNFPAGSPWFDYTWNNKTTSPGGFGKRVLGETWVSHWGKHKFEATRGVIEPASAADPLFNGVTSLFGTTDVYEAAPPSDAKILARGLVLQGMHPTDAPATYRKSTAAKIEQAVNAPAMPIVWTRNHQTTTGAIAKIFTTTLGAATDFEQESLRRLIVNATYWAAGLAVPNKADVTPFDHYA